MANLGNLEQQQGRFGHASRWWVSVIQGSHAEHATRAIHNLGNPELGLGYLEEARQLAPGPGRLLRACRG
jgi:hypothetical protein